MEQPLVSVILTCFNHAGFIENAIRSVRSQTYRNIELIIIDDHSHDESPAVIRKLVLEDPNIRYFISGINQGITKSFNKGFKMSKGSFIIDLSADDELLPERVEEGIKAFEAGDPSCGINFSDAAYMDAAGKFLSFHYKRDSGGRFKTKVPSGNIYPDLLSRYFICTPTMMIKREVIDYLGGYDETLSYEDFDFWIRSSKKYRYCYTDKVLVKKRILTGSLSDRQYLKNSKQVESTYLVCLKAEKINDSETDRKALLKRARYELRKSIQSGNFDTAAGFNGIIRRNGAGIAETGFYDLMIRLGKLLRW